MKPNPLDALIEGYLDYLAHVRRQAPRTVTDVRCTMRRVCEAMSRSHPGVPLWQLSFSDYLRWVEQERQQGRTAACLDKYLSHLRGLLDYAWRSGRSDRNVLDGFRLKDAKQRVPPRVLSLNEARQMVQCSPQGTPVERRDRMILLMLYGCGLRTNELCALNITDVNRERGELSIRKAKGDVQRVVPIPEITKSKDHRNVIANLKRMHDLPRIHLCGKTLYPLEAIKDWVERNVTCGQ